MTERRVRVGVIGAGRFAEQAHIPGVQAHPQGEVVALCSRNRDNVTALAKRVGVPDVYTDYHELLARPDIEAVTVCTPDAMHLPVALAALEAGKHVFCDKPLAKDAAEARQMVDAAERSGLVNMVAFTFRYMRALPELRRLLREGAIGLPFHVTLQVYWGGIISPQSLTWRDQAEHSAAGMWGDGGSHLFDALAYALAPVEEVCAQMMVVPRTEGGDQPDSVDIADGLGRLRLAQGYGVKDNAGGASGSGYADRDRGAVQVTLTSSRVSQPRGPVHEMQVTGTKGALGIPLNRGQNEYLQIARPGGSGWEDLPLLHDASTDQPLALTRMMGAFVDAVLRGNADPDHDPAFAAGLHAQLAMEAGLRSAHSGQWEKV